jgi:hypothetical protein
MIMNIRAANRMEKELQQKLCKKYPKIFTKNFLFECLDGWFWLIDNLCECIQHNKTDLQATQVKEKFGGLRFYTTPRDDEIQGMIELAESMSYHICEKCGSTENVSSTDGWI